MTIQPEIEEPQAVNGTHSGNGMRMTMPPPTREDPSSLSNGHPVEIIDVLAAPADRVVVPRTAVRTTAPKRASDYRLRGLDLDAQGVAESRTRQKRKKHPIVRRRRRRHLIQFLVVVVVAALAAVVLRATVVQPFSITSASMVPTLQPGTDVLVVKPRFLTGGIRAGDIVVLEMPAGSTCRIVSDARHLVSRVIALPGQTIWSENESIFVDGQRLEKPAWRNPPFGELGTTPIARTEIPLGSYFVLGDNRTDTCDSRALGPVPGSLVVGEVVATIARGGHPSVHII